MAQIFISYARTDFKSVNELRQNLENIGFKTWMDKNQVHLLAGRRWHPVIEAAIGESDFIILCLSLNSLSAPGYFQREIKMALDLMLDMPEHYVYVIPVLLEPLEEQAIQKSLREIGWINLYENGGFDDLIRNLKLGVEQRNGAKSLEEIVRTQNVDAEQRGLENQQFNNKPKEAKYKEIEDRRHKIAGLFLRLEQKFEKDAAKRKRRHLTILAGAIAFLLAGFLIYWNWRSHQPVEVLRYVQKFNKDGSFQLRFTPQHNGYLYLIVMDERESRSFEPFTMLTNRQAFYDVYDVEGQLNHLTAGTEFIFPPVKSEKPLTINENFSSGPLTVIFSPEQLKEPKCLDVSSYDESRYKITPDDDEALKKMENTSKTFSTQTIFSENGEKMMASSFGQEPLVFKITPLKQAKVVR